MAVVLEICVLFGVTGSTHADGLPPLYGRAALVVARHLRLVHLTLLPQTLFLRSHDHSTESCDCHVNSMCIIHVPGIRS